MPTLILTAALITLGMGWVGYPLVLIARAPRSKRPLGGWAPNDTPWPFVTVVLATREAPDEVRRRVENLLETEFPRDHLRIVVAVDATAPYPKQSYELEIRTAPNIEIVAGDAPGGKASTLNAGIRATDADFLVFADTAQVFERTTIPALVRPLLEPRIGGVTGTLTSEADQGILGLFWRYEIWLRGLENRLGAVVVATGAVHAIRREFWQPLPPGLLCDDLLIPLRTARQGGQVVAEAAAKASDPRRFERTTQLIRRVRTLTGILQVCAWEPWVLSPVRNPHWLGFVCHKLIRIATPFLAMFAVLAGFASLPAWVALGAVGLAAVGLTIPLLMSGWPLRRCVSEAGWVLRLLGAPIQAAYNALRGRWDVWQPHPPRSTIPLEPPQRPDRAARTSR